MSKLEDLAKNGDVGAQYYLSILLEDGVVLPQDSFQSAKWCTEAARAGDRLAQYRLSKMLESGRGFDKRHEREAWYWLKKAAAKGHTQAQFELGLRHLFGVCGVFKSFYHARRWLRAAAEREHSEAAYYLGFMYRHGLSVVASQESAFFWFQKSARLGYSKALCALGCMYEHGIGCAKNLDQSRCHYEGAATTGHVGAQFGLGLLCFSCGRHNDAIIWLDIAANNGVLEAQAALADIYVNGIGIKRDLVAAAMWCIVVENSDEVAEELLTAVQRCHRIVAASAKQNQLDSAYTKAWDWLSRRAELPLVVETDWNERIKMEIAAYEKRTKRWT